MFRYTDKMDKFYIINVSLTDKKNPETDPRDAM